MWSSFVVLIRNYWVKFLKKDMSEQKWIRSMKDFTFVPSSSLICQKLLFRVYLELYVHPLSSSMLYAANVHISMPWIISVKWVLKLATNCIKQFGKSQYGMQIERQFCWSGNENLSVLLIFVQRVLSARELTRQYSKYANFCCLCSRLAVL